MSASIVMLLLLGGGVLLALGVLSRCAWRNSETVWHDPQADRGTMPGSSSDSYATRMQEVYLETEGINASIDGRFHGL